MFNHYNPTKPSMGFIEDIIDGESLLYLLNCCCPTSFITREMRAAASIQLWLVCPTLKTVLFFNSTLGNSLIVGIKHHQLIDTQKWAAIDTIKPDYYKLIINSFYFRLITLINNSNYIEKIELVILILNTSQPEETTIKNQWFFICFLRSPGVENVLSQWLQGWGLIFSWVILW